MLMLLLLVLNLLNLILMLLILMLLLLNLLHLILMLLILLLLDMVLLMLLLLLLHIMLLLLLLIILLLFLLLMIDVSIRNFFGRPSQVIRLLLRALDRKYILRWRFPHNRAHAIVLRWRGSVLEYRSTDLLDLRSSNHNGHFWSGTRRMLLRLVLSWEGKDDLLLPRTWTFLTSWWRSDKGRSPLLPSVWNHFLLHECERAFFRRAVDWHRIYWAPSHNLDNVRGGLLLIVKISHLAEDIGMAVVGRLEIVVRRREGSLVSVSVFKSNSTRLRLLFLGNPVVVIVREWSEVGFISM
jgi:hypothetical protein